MRKLKHLPLQEGVDGSRYVSGRSPSARHSKFFFGHSVKVLRNSLYAPMVKHVQVPARPQPPE